jgi:surface protein
MTGIITLFACFMVMMVDTAVLTMAVVIDLNNATWSKPRHSQGRVLNAYTPLTDLDIKSAAILWVSDQTSATSMYGPVHTWDLSQVTSLEKVWCGYDSTACSSEYVAMRSFNGDVSMWDVSRVTTMSNTFRKSSAFNSDISKWDVSRVTNMRNSKSIRILENDLTWRNMLL